MDDEFYEFEEPDWTKVQLDWSQAHFLDHSVWACRWQYGGRRQHLRLRWQLGWRPAVHRYTLCRLGIHREIPAAHRGKRLFICPHCLKSREA